MCYVKFIFVFGGLGRGGEAPKDFTKPRQTIQSPSRQYKAPTDNTKPRKDYWTNT